MPRLGPEIDQHLLDDRLHILRPHERSLEIDLREFRLPVRAEVLVAKTAGELEVPIVAGDHQELLVDLGRLGQRVEFATMHAARHEIVASAFGGRLGKDRCLDLKEAELGHGLPAPLEEPVPQEHVPLQFGAAKVQNAVAQAKLF